MVHLVDLVLRMSAGAVPHLDFMTPIGEWAIRPMAILHNAGLPLGGALIWAQFGVAIVLFPALVWTAVSRLNIWQATIFGIVVLGLCMGVVSGGAEPNISLSMHYNRWAWAATLIVIVLGLVPEKAGPRPVLDGLSIGVLMAALAMVKITFALALAVPVIAVLLLRGRAISLGLSLLCALAILILVTLDHGLGYWFAYIDDLRAVVGSANRPMPSATLSALILSPVATPITLAVLAAILILRRRPALDPGGWRVLGLVLGFPAFVFVSWQNYGNDPIWLAALAIVLWSWARPGGEPRSDSAGLAVVAIVMAAFVAPALANILYSPLRHLNQPRAAFRPLLPDNRGEGVMMVAARASGAWGQNTLIAPAGEEPLRLADQILPECELQAGLVTMIEAQVDALRAMEPRLDQQPFVTDLFTPHWLFSDLKPLSGGTPWYYGDLPGMDAATHILVPICPADPTARAHIIGLIQAADLTLVPTAESDHFRLYEIKR